MQIFYISKRKIIMNFKSLVKSAAILFAVIGAGNSIAVMPNIDPGIRCSMGQKCSDTTTHSPLTFIFAPIKKGGKYECFFQSGGGSVTIMEPRGLPEGVTVTDGLLVGKALPARGKVDASKMVRQSADMSFTFRTSGGMSATVLVECWAEGSL